MNGENKKNTLGFGDRKMALTIDVEDYFQVGAFFDCIAPEDWPKFELRVRVSTEKILDLCSRHNIKATFFVLGWVAERCPALIHDILKQGHELACHGYSHQRVCEMDAKSFLDDTYRASSILEDISGRKIKGYRAPCFSINKDTPWAFDTLASLGFLYSSSTYPISHDHYGTPDWPATPFVDQKSGILELPQSVVSIAGKNFPAGGGGYFRLFPTLLNKWLIKKFHEQQNHSYIFYCHPWEVDPDQPRIAQASIKSKFRHYVNQSHMLRKIDEMCQWGPWDTLENIYIDYFQDDKPGIRT